MKCLDEDKDEHECTVVLYKKCASVPASLVILDSIEEDSRCVLEHALGDHIWNDVNLEAMRLEAGP